MVTSPEFRAYYGSDNIRSIIDLFEKLLEEKYKIFSGYVDVEAKNTIEKYKNEIIDNADDIISTIADIRGEANNDI